MLAEALGDTFGDSAKAIRYLCTLTVILLLVRPLPALLGRIPTVDWSFSAADPIGESAAELLPRLETALDEELTKELSAECSLAPDEFSLEVSLTVGESGAGIEPRQITLTLFTLRAVARTDRLREALAEFGCPVEIREQLLDGKETP